LFIELLDLLRCINSHEETWLVASLKAISNRFVLDGTLGCPVCHAEYPIRKGIADFTGGAELGRAMMDDSRSRQNREELATRIGAFLNATEPGASVVLGGSWAEAAQELSVMTDTRVLALNAGKRVEESETVALIRVGSEIPLAPGSVLGVALDASFPAEAISSALRVVRPGGRIVAAVEIQPSGDLAVLASDERYWVAEKPVEMVPLRRSKIAE
jgi:uncharacterized protein YbaR (Trm112 family)